MSIYKKFREEVSVSEEIIRRIFMVLGIDKIIRIISTAYTC